MLGVLHRVVGAHAPPLQNTLQKAVYRGMHKILFTHLVGADVCTEAETEDILLADWRQDAGPSLAPPSTPLHPLLPPSTPLSTPFHPSRYPFQAPTR